MEILCSQNGKNGVLEVLKIKAFFAVPPWWTIFLRISLCGFHTGSIEKSKVTEGLSKNVKKIL